MTFRTGQDVAVVEHDPETRQPIAGGHVWHASVTEASALCVEVRYENGSKDTFRPRLGWRAWGNAFRWRLVHVCTRCERPILDTPRTDPSDPLKRQYCGEECRDADAESAQEQHYPSGVAT